MATPDDQIADLPPRLPETLAELDEARSLLGLCANKRPMTTSGRARLAKLVGCAPSSKDAALWKRTLGVYRDELQGGEL